MAVHVVGASQMLRDMFGAICTARNYTVQSSVPGLNDVEAVGADDLVLFHTTCQDRRVVDQVSAFRERLPHARLLIVTGRDLPADVEAALVPEVDGIIPEGKSGDALIAALTVLGEGYRIVRAGRVIPTRWVAADHASARPDALAQAVPPPSTGAVRANLSQRESAILAKLTEGVTNKDIANELGICEATVKVHLRTCFRKIGAKNRTQAAIWAVEKL